MGSERGFVDVCMFCRGGVPELGVGDGAGSDELHSPGERGHHCRCTEKPVMLDVNRRELAGWKQ